MPTPKDDILLYFNQTVCGHYNKYVDEKYNQVAGRNTDLDAALISAGILYHFRERLPNSWRLNAKFLNSVHPDYALLGDIVNVSKHNSLDLTRSQYKNRKPLISNIDNITQVVLLIEYEDEDGLYYDSQKCVFVKLDNGINRDIYQILNAVLNLWIKELNSLKVLDNMAPVAIISKGIPPRPNEAGTGNLGLSILAKTPIRGIFHFMKYNYQTGKLDPGTVPPGIKLTIYDMPRHDVEVTYTSKDGHVIHKKMKVSEVDYQHLMSLETDVEQHAFLISLLRKAGLINEVKDEVTKLRES